jgi:hypothetical protein
LTKLRHLRSAESDERDPDAASAFVRTRIGVEAFRLLPRGRRAEDKETRADSRRDIGGDHRDAAFRARPDCRARENLVKGNLNRVRSSDPVSPTWVLCAQEPQRGISAPRYGALICTPPRPADGSPSRRGACVLDSDGTKTFVRARAYEFRTSRRTSGRQAAIPQEWCGHRPGAYMAQS